MAKSVIAPPKSINGGSEHSSVILNPNRPSNPFSPTEEPDWVAVPRSNSRLSSFSSSISSSPYEHINHSTILGTSASSSAPRKLPPPLEPTTLPAKIGRINISDEPASMKSIKSDAPPPPPPPRRQTNTALAHASSVTSSPTPLAIPSSRADLSSSHPKSSPSSLTQISTHSTKAPPPVARKPAHLTSTSPSSAETGGFSSLDEHASKPSLPRRSTGNVSNLTTRLEANGSGPLTGGMQKTRPTQSSSGMSGLGRVSTLPNSAVPSTAVGLPGLGTAQRSPDLPPRPQQQRQSPQRKPVPSPAKKSVIDLLGPDTGVEMQGWETLKPS